MSKFNTNIASFLAAANALPQGDIVRCYCFLVAIELCLKANCSISGGHDIDNLLKSYLRTVPVELAPVAGISISPSMASTATNLIARLQTEIRNIWVTSPTGAPGRARPTAYPDIRYARFNQDLWTPITNNVAASSITSLDLAIASILNFLRSDLGLSL